MDPVIAWTGETACALQSALRMTNEAFAEHLGVAVRTVATWHQRPDISQKAAMQQILDVALQQASPTDRQRFYQLTNATATTPPDAERQLDRDPNMAVLLEWLDGRAQWTPGTARRSVIERLAAVDAGQLQERRQCRMQIRQPQVAAALAQYYDASAPYSTFQGTYGSNAFATTILTRPDWVNLATELTVDADGLQLVNDSSGTLPTFDAFAADRAITRLTEAVAICTRIYDLPLYRLLTTNIRSGHIGGTVNLNSFAEYALTLDLLEGELIEAIADQKDVRSETLPIRARRLPDIRSVIDLPNRLCAGGALALFAIARPQTVHHAKDFLVLVQERSGQVLNSARRLSLTQGFHQPMIDYRVETRLALTLMREIEEEMFGREELDNTVSDARHADPMHPSRLTRPMRWLTKAPGRMRIESTGFGLNLVNGNYEFANIVVIEDEKFWDKFGGYIEANWEAGSLRRYSTQDYELIKELVSEPMWTNEGLFTLILGLQRLSQLDPTRVRFDDVKLALG